MRAVEVVVALVVGATGAAAQPVPQPFPAPTRQAAQPVTRPAAPSPAPQPASPAPARTAAPAVAGEAAPTEVTLGVAIFPTAQFLGSFNAGSGQRYYLFGATASFADVVTYYRGVLKDRGELVFDAPAIHMFDTGRFREETMAFPPSVTVKDYTWGGKGGYLNPVRGAQPARYPTILQIVPATAPTP